MSEITQVQPSSPSDWGGRGHGEPAWRLWLLWREGRRPDLREFLSGIEELSVAQLVDVLRVDQRERWLLGERIAAETYLEAYASLRADSDLALDLICSEFLVREELGEAPALDEYLRRFPQFAAELRLQVELHRAIGTDPGLGMTHPRTWRSIDQGPPPAPSRCAGLAVKETVIAGYEILDELGRGGMGVVYRAWQTELRRVVALKMILAGASPPSLVRFQIEAEAVARLQHPNIVQVHDAGQQDGRPFLVLELVEGVSLAKQIAGAPQPLTASARLIATLARAMHYAHQRGVIHRDLTPANVLLTAEGVPKITDFGLAKLIIGGAETCTKTGDLLGTPSYMAPEQATSKPQDNIVATDIYALGAILYEMLTGRPPFRGETPLETLRLVVDEEPVSPARLRPKLPRDLETICLKCLRKDPKHRYESAEALAEDLDCYLRGEPIRARRRGPFGRAWVWTRRRPMVAGLVATIVALATLGLTGILWQWRRAEIEWRRAERALARVELALYANLIALADNERSAGNIGRADQILDRCRQPLRGWEWFFLKRLCHTELMALRGHGDHAFAAVYSPDGRRIASGGSDRTVRIWDAATGRLLMTLSGHSIDVRALAFSPDGQMLASAAAHDNLSNPSVGPGEVILWNLTTGQPRLTYRGHDGGVLSVAFHPGGQRLASAGRDQTVRVWDAATGHERWVFRDHHGPVHALAFHPRGRLLASGGGGAGSPGEVCLWDLESGRRTWLPQRHSDKVPGLAFRPDGRELASVSSDGTIRFWDPAQGAEVGVLTVDSGGLSHVTYSPDGSQIAVAGQDHTVRVFDAESHRERFVLRKHTESVESISYAPDGRHLVSAGMDGSVLVWSAKGPPVPLVLKGHTDRVHYIAFTPDGRRIVTTGRDSTVRVWDAATGHALAVFRDHKGEVWSASARGDGQVASAGWDRTVRIWDVATGHALRTLAFDHGLADCVTFSPDGRLIAACGGEVGGSGVVMIWNAENGRLLRILGRHRRFVECVTFSPDGRWLASAANDGTARVWDVATGRERHVLRGQTRSIVQVAYRPDGKWLASAESDGTIRLWDAESGQELRALRDHTSKVTALRFSPDGRRLVSSSWDRTVKIWNPESGQEMLTLRGHGSRVAGMDFSPDGSRLVTAESDGLVRIWDGSPLPGLAPSQRRPALGLRDGGLPTYLADSFEGLQGLQEGEELGLRRAAQRHKEVPLAR